MPGKFHYVSLDNPYLQRFEEAHAIDSDPQSTTMAISIVQDAVANGHPGNDEAAVKVLTGPSAAMVVQATMKPFHDRATTHDQAGEQHSLAAVDASRAAKQTAEWRGDLINETVQLSDGTSRTRGQVHAGHDARLAAAAQRETRGDLEHNARPPSLAGRWLVVVVLALIEVFLLIWPVTDANWADAKSVAYVGGLVVLFVFMNEQLPKITGLAIREAREAVHAARELTHVGLTASRSDEPGAGRETTGHVDERFVRTAERKRATWCAVLGTVMAIYATVMFSRVERLAAGLDWPLTFVLLAAALITVFTVGGMLVLTWWWSRGNALGDQLREYGAITDESRSLAEDLAEEYQDHVRGSEQAAAEAHSELDLGERAMYDGYHTVGVGLQKAAKILDQEKVHIPKPTNLFAIGRPIRSRAAGHLDEAKAILAEAGQILASASPFDPAVVHPDPWTPRSAPRQARANPAFVDPYQLGVLHTLVTEHVPLWRRPRLWTVLGAALVILIGLLVIATLVQWLAVNASRKRRWPDRGHLVGGNTIRRAESRDWCGRRWRYGPARRRPVFGALNETVFGAPGTESPDDQVRYPAGCRAGPGRRLRVGVPACPPPARQPRPPPAHPAAPAAASRQGLRPRLQPMATLGSPRHAAPRRSDPPRPPAALQPAGPARAFGVPRPRPLPPRPPHPAGRTPAGDGTAVHLQDGVPGRCHPALPWARHGYHYQA